MVIPAHFEEIPRSRKSRDPRRMLCLKAEGLTGDGGTARVLVHNISASGLLVESDEALVPGERIDVDLPQAGPIAAKVIWASGSFFGCQFDAPISTATLSAAQLRSDVPDEPAHAPLPTSESFAVRLQRLRKRRGLTMAQLAERLGVSKPTVWAWEQGRARPVEARMEALAAALEVPEHEIVSDSGTLALSAVIARAKEEIAGMLGVSSDKIRIAVDL